MNFFLCDFCALLWLNKLLEAELMAVGGDRDGAAFAGSENCGAV